MTLEHAADEADIEEQPEPASSSRATSQILERIERLERRILEMEKTILSASMDRGRGGADAARWPEPAGETSQRPVMGPGVGSRVR